jgi:bifunctional DNA-binding transcriptional regulator/antitoxin component of YhaV-PrlF toxin-antitoxin module
MQAYKFETKISEGGTISLPYAIPNLYGMEVELFIVPKEVKPKIIKKASAKNFVSRWAGFLNDMNVDTENAKYEYLSEKYK